jgi:hypothetical protein
MKLDELKSQFFGQESALDWNKLVELDKNNQIDRNFLSSIELKKQLSSSAAATAKCPTRLFTDPFTGVTNTNSDNGVNFRDHNSFYENGFKLIDDKYSSSSSSASSNSTEPPTCSSSSSSASSTAAADSGDETKNRNSNSTNPEEEENVITTEALTNNNNTDGPVEQPTDNNNNNSQLKSGMYFKTERSIQLLNNKTQTTTVTESVPASTEPSQQPSEDPGGKVRERDDFDDLVDLSHRPEKVEFKKESSLEKKKQRERDEEKKVYNALCSSSLPPLPPLPYSFVKLEQKSKLNPKSSSFLSLSSTGRVRPPSGFRNETATATAATAADEQKTIGCKSEETTESQLSSSSTFSLTPSASAKKVVRSATTRLIIPINTDKAASQSSNSPYCITTTSSLVNEAGSSPVRSNSLPRNGFGRSGFFQQQQQHQLDSNKINVQVFDLNTNGTSKCTSLKQKSPNDSSLNKVNGTKLLASSSPKQKDVGREWDQVSFFFK